MMFDPQPKTGRTKKKAARSAKVPESAIQKAAEMYLDAFNLTYIRIPDSLYKVIFGPHSQISGHVARLISDCLRGVPDLNILLDNGKYLCVELKSTIGKQSQAQKAFERGVGPDNYYVCRSFDEFKTVLDKFRLENA